MCVCVCVCVCTSFQYAMSCPLVIVDDVLMSCDSHPMHSCCGIVLHTDYHIRKKFMDNFRAFQMILLFSLLMSDWSFVSLLRAAGPTPCCAHSPLGPVPLFGPSAALISRLIGTLFPPAPKFKARENTT